MLEPKKRCESQRIFGMSSNKARPLPDISCIIVNYQSADILPACFSSFANVSFSGSYEILVANNDAREREALRTLQKRFQFSIIDLPENRGFSNASNEAAKIARGRALLFLNPDTRFLSGDFSSSLASLSEGKVGVIGFQLLKEQTLPEAWSSGREVTLFSLIANHFRFFSRPWRISSEQSVAWVSGAAFLVSRELFVRLGGFDERFFLYYEDVDFCFRAREVGKTVWLSPTVSVLHIGGKSMRSVGYSHQKAAYYKSQEQYFHRHRPKYEGVILRLLHVVFCAHT